MSVDKTDVAIYVKDDEGYERLALRASPSGVHVGVPVWNPHGFMLSPEDADAVEAWLRDERKLREAGGPGAGSVQDA